CASGSARRDRTTCRSSWSRRARCSTSPRTCPTRPRRSRTPSTWTSSARPARTGSTAPTPTSSGSSRVNLGLEGRVAVVCGSSAGLGRAVARALAEEGARLVVNSRSEGRVREARDEIAGATGAEVEAIAADLTDPAGVRALVSGATARFGRIDILVTNTGGPPSGPFEAHGPEIWREASERNLESVVDRVGEVLPGMKQRGWGRILNVTSISVKQPVAGLNLADAIRAAVTDFARTVANE